jgi:hypothetical protein
VILHSYLIHLICRYVFMLDSLPSKCRSLWKYASAAMAVQHTTHGIAPLDSGLQDESSVDLGAGIIVPCSRCVGPVWNIPGDDSLRCGAVGSAGTSVVPGLSLHMHLSTTPFRDDTADH